MLFEEISNYAAEAKTVCAVTDLMNGVLLLPLIFLLYRIKSDKTEEKRHWILFLASLSLCNLLGFFVHNYCSDPPLLNHIVWIPMYTVMIEVVIRFFLLSLGLFRDFSRPMKKPALLCRLFFLPILVCCCVFEFFGHNMILLYVISAALLCLFSVGLLVYKSISCRSGSYLPLFLSFVFLIPVIPFQINKEISFSVFDHNSLTHICITLCQIFLFFAAEKSIRRK